MVQSLAVPGRVCSQVLLSEATYAVCGVEVLRVRGTLIAHMGEHVLEADKPPVQLYTCTTKEVLLHRYATLGPVRSLRTTSAPFLCAPCASLTSHCCSQLQVLIQPVTELAACHLHCLTT